MPSAKTTALVILMMTVDVFRAADDDDDGTSKWIQLCTLTGEGSPRLNVSMPCGFRVESESDAAGGNEADEGSRNYIRVDIIKDGVREGSQAQDDRVKTQNEDGEVQDDVFKTQDDGVKTQHEDDETQDDGVKTQDADGETLGDSVKTQHEDGETQDDGVKTQDADGETQDDSVKTQHEDDETQDGDGVKGLDRTETTDHEETGNPGVQEQNVDVRLEAIASGGTGNEYQIVDDYDSEYNEDDITVEVDDHGVGGGNEREEQLGPVPAVKTVVFSYLQDARDQLYNNIHYLLSLLQRAFFNARHDRRSRRHSVDRRTAMNKAEGRQTANGQHQTTASAILKPTFERSMMTMSFLMFGVFVIQVVQRLIQTLQQSGEMMSMENPVPGNIPTASASIY